MPTPHTDPIVNYIKVLSAIKEPMTSKQIKTALNGSIRLHTFKVSICLIHLETLGLVESVGALYKLTQATQEALQSPEPHVAVKAVYLGAKGIRRCHICGSTDELEWYQVKWWCRQHLIGQEEPYTPWSVSPLSFAPAMAGWSRSGRSIWGT